MKRSENRILTTHAGSLRRPPALEKLILEYADGKEVDRDALAREIEAGTRLAVREQIAAGIDIGNNGEQSRESFTGYLLHRISGFSIPSAEDFAAVSDETEELIQDIAKFPSYKEERIRLGFGEASRRIDAIVPNGAVRHVDRKPLEDECALLKKLCAEQGGGFVEPFLNAASPGCLFGAGLNPHYGNPIDFATDLAAALAVEYEYVVSQDILLQVDCPDLAMGAHIGPPRPLDVTLAQLDYGVQFLNMALRNVRKDRVRIHVCYGNYGGPHVCDVPLGELLPTIYKANVGGFIFPFGNPRHAHETRVFEKHPPPDDTIIVAGVVDTTTNYVEHPELVADRIEQVARAVGDPTRVMASPDCGFGSAAGFYMVAEEVVWEKLRTLRAGADIATKRLFS